MVQEFIRQHLTVKNIIFVLIAILFIVFIANAKDIAILFFAAYVIACSLNPVVNKLTEFKIKKEFAAAIALLGTLCIISIFFIPVIYIAGHEIKSFINHAPLHIENIKIFILNLPFVNKSLLSHIDMGAFLSSASDITSGFVNKSINAGINLASAFIYCIAAVIIIYYFLADKENVKKGYLSLFPPQMKEKATDIIKNISRKIGGYVIAQIATISSVGFIMTIGLLLSGIEYAFLLGLITALLDIIPVIGPGIALIICLITAFKSGILSMFLVLVVFAVAQIVENNLVRPYVFGKMLDIHPLLIYLFLFLTAQHLGIAGVIFAPAIAATFCVLLEELYIKNIN